MSLLPNILWICTDQQRFDTIGALGNRHVHTPVLDRMVKEGVAFTRAYCQNPICAPSRASFMTGRYPGAIHANTNGNEYFPKEAEATLVSRLLAEGGYDCGLVGKFHLAGCAGRREPRVNDGFRYFQWSHSPRPNWKPGEHDYADWLREQGRDPAEVLALRSPRKDRLLEPTPEEDNVPVELHHTTWDRIKSVDFLEEATGPWMLCINTFEPHPPFNPPYEYYRRFDPESMPGAHYQETDIAAQRKLADAGIYFQHAARPPYEMDQRKTQAAYYAMIEFIDHEIGVIVEKLASMNQLDNTVVIFTSDHGEMLGDHGLFNKGCRFYEGAVRVPLIWWRPGLFRQDMRCDELVELTDIAPTLLELAGLEVPALMQGKSLLPLLQGTAPIGPHRSYVRSEFYDSQASPNATFATMYLEGNWKLIDYHSAGTGELFNLEEDPWEFRNMWDLPEYREKRWELTKRSFDTAMLNIDPGPPRTRNH